MDLRLNNPPKLGDALAISGFSYCMGKPGQKGPLHSPLLLILQNKKHGAGEKTLWVRSLGEQARELESRSRVPM